MKEHAISGLDIGSTKTCAVIAVPHDGGLEILGIGEAPSSGMRRGVVTNLEEVVRSIELATERAERMAGTSLSSIYLGIGGEHVRTHSSNASVAIVSDSQEINERDVMRVLEASRRIEISTDRRILHTLPRGFSLDGVNGVINPVGLEAKRLEVDAHVVSGGAPMIANLLKCVEMAGLESIGMVYGPLASSAATLDREAMLAGAMLIDFGGGATHVALISRGRVVHTAIVPIGGLLITSDLAMGLRMSLSEAERIKTEFDWHAPEGAKIIVKGEAGRRDLEIEQSTVRSIIIPRLQELLRHVRAELAKATYPDLRIEEIVVTGGGARLSGIEEVCREYFGLPARLGLPANVEGLTDETMQPQYAAAIGLLVYGPSGAPRTTRPRRMPLVRRIAHWLGDLWN